VSDIFSGIGQVAGAALQADAVKTATRMQIDALRQQREFVFNNLNPSVINAQATAGDIQNTMARLALQGQVDPALLQARYQSENQMLSQAQQIGQQSGAVGTQAAQEALAGTPGMTEAKNGLVDAALKQLSAGATLPPDVENQLVQAGLEQSGMVTQGASGRGIGGQMLRTVLGTAGLNLQMQRQQQAAQLSESAQNLENSRQNILQQLFPRLSQTQLANLGGTQSVLGTSASMLPNAGLSGQNIANIWLARVGATNQLAQSSADAAARGTMGQATAWGNAFGGAGSALGSAIPTISGWFGGGGGGGGGGNAADLGGLALSAI
jgi:hypothetical protein